jgi:hypothetical protein
MPGVSAIAEAILEFPQFLRHFQKCLISANACDIYMTTIVFALESIFLEPEPSLSFGFKAQT